jgi:hypothetical protein
MLSEQLYYPNIVPEITPRFALSLLHWDKVVRIFPKHQVESGKYQPSSISALEYEGLLESEQLDETDKDKCWEWFEKIVTSVNAPMGPGKLEAEMLVKECHIKGRNNYFIFRGKSNIQLSKEYPKLFIEDKDEFGNDVFVCSKETGLTYMTLMSYFVCERRKFGNAITDHANAFPLFIFLKTHVGFSSAEIPEFHTSINQNRYVDRIFYMPLIRFLEPKISQDPRIIENIISFRKNRDNEKLRIKYLKRIKALLAALKTCSNDKEAKQVAAFYEGELSDRLVMILEFLLQLSQLVC